MDEARVAALLAGVAILSSCDSTQPDRQAKLVAIGERVFLKETFNGNGRTCATCHPPGNNFTIDAAFIATLPRDDALFVAEFNPHLRKNFEKPELMRKFGLILENQDGFDDLANNFNLRGVPHTLALRTSIDSDDGPRTGWSGDGAPGDESLRSFAVGAVIQHFPKTLNRIPGVDFRLPTDAELDALEAFQLSLGRQDDLTLPLPLTGIVPARGQEIFLDDTLGKCNLCHVNAGANAAFGGSNVGNANFNTGVEDLPDQPADLTGAFVPPDDGLGTPGDGTFNTPPLVEAADSGPFFHNNSIQTIEGSVAFYNGDAFNNSPSGRFLASIDPNEIGIKLDATQVVAVAAFLRVINALENIRQSIAFLDQSMGKRHSTKKSRKELIGLAVKEIKDTIRVLEGGSLHPEADPHLKEAKKLAKRAAHSLFGRRKMTKEAIRELKRARDLMVENS